MNTTIKRWLASAMMVGFGIGSALASDLTHGSLLTEHLVSEKLRDTRTRLDPNRVLKVYLPPHYEVSGRAYPVVYYFHSLGSNPEKTLADSNMVTLIERGFSNGIVDEFILVVGDYSTPTLGSWYENSSTTGRWLDFTVDELVPFVDAHFHTLRQRESRALVGDFVGAYGAFKFGMLYPEMFSVVYGLHLVGAGTGVTPGATRVDWTKIHQAHSFQDLDRNGFARPFVAMAQAYLPNPNRPPFFCDFFVEPENGVLKVRMENVKKWESGFLLDHLLMEKGENLQRLRGLAFDWARYDPNPDHVYAAQAFTRKLDELGIEHEAEEYRGDPWNKNWTENGRFYTRVLPFLNRTLAFAEIRKSASMQR